MARLSMGTGIVHAQANLKWGGPNTRGLGMGTHGVSNDCFP